MSLNTDVYKKVPLPLDTSNKIRLLQIKRSGRWNKTISCTFREYPMNQSPPYIALSYMWGTDTTEQRIRLQGHPFLVRKNLADFLQQISTEEPSDKFYWIDAICINQDNLAERGHQVSLMGLIYSKASSVLVWLGSGDPELHCAVKFVNSHEENLRKHTFQEGDWKHAEVEVMAGLRKLIHSEYWSRAWIVQECTLASQLDLQYGKTKVDSRTFARLYDVIGGYFQSNAGEILKASTRWNAISTRSYVPPWAPDSLRLHCSDNRDRIYSQLALMHPDVDIDPDYTKSCQDLLTEVVCKYISLDWWEAERIITKLAIMLSPNGEEATQIEHRDCVKALKERARETGATNRLNTKAIAISVPLEIQAENFEFERFQSERAGQ